MNSKINDLKVIIMRDLCEDSSYTVTVIMIHSICRWKLIKQPPKISSMLSAIKKLAYYTDIDDDDSDCDDDVAANHDENDNDGDNDDDDDDDDGSDGDNNNNDHDNV